MIAIAPGDCLTAMREAFEDNTFDAIVTDPPYGLEFMGKGWDAPWKHGFSAPGYGDAERLERPSFTSSRNPICLACKKRQRTWEGGPAKCACSSPAWDRKQSDEMQAFQAWCEEWAREALRVAKPGAHLVAFGGTRTYHRLACAIEDAGWEVRDSIGFGHDPGLLAYCYGSGFPKSLDVSKAIDKAAGAEREVVGTRPIAYPDSNCWGVPNRNSDGAVRSVAHGVVVGNARGGVRPLTAPATDAAKQWQGWGTALKPAWEPIILARKPLVGTVAANVLTHGTGAINVDACRIGNSKDVPASVSRAKGLSLSGSVDGSLRRQNGTEGGFNPNLGRWPANVALDEEAAAMLDEQTGTLTSGKASTAGHRRKASMGAATGAALEGNADGSLRSNEDAGVLYGDSGGASRFFYTAKASRKERGEGNTHPTVKPLSLMRWLVRLVTPKGGVVLDPFAGSGTTLLAAQAEGFDAVGIEREAEYVEIIKRRLGDVGVRCVEVGL